MIRIVRSDKKFSSAFKRPDSQVLLFTFLFACCAAGESIAQTAPVVSNVRASQRGDASKLVDVYYDLEHNAPCTVWVVFSGDGGTTWNIPAMTLSGHLGHNVAPGSDRHIIWDAPADIPGVAGTYRARVYADDGQTSGDMVLVPAGSFPYQGNFANWIFVDSFFIDRFEVTNQRYAEFLNDADPDGTYWNGNMEITRSGTEPDIYYAVDPGRQNYPIRYVSAVDADAYGEWLSAREGRNYRLPTEQEWEKAAAWDPTIDKHWLYGFQKDTISCADANYYDGGSQNGCPGVVTEVGHYDGTGGTNDSRSFYGAYDMSGNVWEWTSSGNRVIRGGAWYNSATDSQATYRNTSTSTNRSNDFGFRLALDLD